MPTVRQKLPSMEDFESPRLGGRDLRVVGVRSWTLLWIKPSNGEGKFVVGFKRPVGHFVSINSHHCDAKSSGLGVFNSSRRWSRDMAERIKRLAVVYNAKGRNVARSVTLKLNSNVHIPPGGWALPMRQEVTESFVHTNVEPGFDVGRQAIRTPNICHPG